MTGAVDSRRPVEPTTQNLKQDAATVVLIPAASKSISGSTFKQLLSDGENKASPKSVTDEKVDVDNQTEVVVVEQTEQLKDTPVSQPELIMPVKPASTVTVEPAVLTVATPETDGKQLPSDTAVKGESLVKETSDISRDIKSEVDAVDSVVRSELVDDTNIPVASQQNNKAIAEPAVPVLRAAVEQAVVVAAPVAEYTSSIDTSLEDSVSTIPVQPQLATADRTEKKLTADVLTAIEPEQATIRVPENNIARSVAGRNEILQDNELPPPVLPGRVAAEQTVQAKQSPVVQSILVNGVSVESAATSLQNDGQRQLQATPFTAVDSSITSSALTAATDVSTALRTPSPSLVDGARSQAFEALPQTAANHIKMMMDQGIGRATVQLNPADLGSMRINIDLKADQINVQISVVQGTTREALESNLPRLRAQLEADGYVGVNIDFEGGQAGSRNSGQMNSRDSGLDYFTEPESEGQLVNSPVKLAVQTKRSLVDLFA